MIRKPKYVNNAESYYMTLISAGILLRLDGDNLIIDAPNNNVSPVLQAAVEKRKAALVAHLRSLPA